MLDKTDLNISIVLITGTFHAFKLIINIILEKSCGQVNVNSFIIGGHIGFANLAYFHHMDFSGLLACHSRDLAETNYSDFICCNFFEVDPKIEIDYLDYKICSPLGHVLP